MGLAHKLKARNSRVSFNFIIICKYGPLPWIHSEKKNVLDPETLALGEMWVDSAKSKRNLVEFAYNRYMNNDENLPGWFEDDERKHWRKQVPVTKVRNFFISLWLLKNLISWGSGASQSGIWEL